MSARVLARLGLAMLLAAPLVSVTPASAAAPPAPRVHVRGGVRLACPVGAGAQLTNSFGDRRGGGRRHAGIDIMAPMGTPIYAIESGTIVRAYTSRAGGLSIYLRTAAGVEYFYAHQSANLVRTGQAVRVGQVIGRVGNSGNARGTSPHLHFERLLSGRRPVDPYGLVRQLC